jgi:small subunit ribosomal protein S17
MDKTVVVEVERLAQHPKYKKYIRKRKKFYAHDERNESRVGDIVEIQESRPLSRLKRWVVKRIIQRAPDLSRFSEDSQAKESQP